MPTKDKNKNPENPDYFVDGYTTDLEESLEPVYKEVEEVMKKYDRESNTRIWTGVPKQIVTTIMACFSLYCIYSTLFSVAALEKRLTAFLGLVIIMGYLYYPVSKHHVKPNTFPWYDAVIMLLGAGAFFWYCFKFDTLAKILTSTSKMTPLYTTIAVIGVLALMELCRRCVGIPILCVAGALLVYTFAFAGISLPRAMHSLFYSTSGVLGTPSQVCAKFIVVFIVFGAFLERTGIAKFFIDLANKLAGASAGGPAKVAVISSALCGMVSGSSVGNTVTTGSVTIPMMKRTGYEPDFAGAVEASASTGGQIMPPIMGAAAFLMAEYMGVTYAEVALRAILPAVLYFTGIFIAVHLEAKKLGLKGIPAAELTPWKVLLKKMYLLAPLVVLVWLVSTNTRTMAYSAAIAILVAILVSLPDKNNRITPKRFVEALEAGGKGTITVAVACSMAGVIAGCITITGLASKLISAIITISGGHLFVGLFLTMICCIILGMGVPTTANYCIMAATCAPILIKMGLPTVAAHFFVFYFGIVADITPPVALAAYAGSAIAKGNAMKTGWNATKLAIAAFVVPYIFAFDPTMLFVNAGVFDVIKISITSVIGIFGVAAAFNGFLYKKLHPALRVAIGLGGLMLMYPTTVTDIIGLALCGGVILYQYFASKKEQPLAT